MQFHPPPPPPTKPPTPPLKYVWNIRVIIYAVCFLLASTLKYSLSPAFYVSVLCWFADTYLYNCMVKLRVSTGIRPSLHVLKLSVCVVKLETFTLNVNIQYPTMFSFVPAYLPVWNCEIKGSPIMLLTNLGHTLPMTVLYLAYCSSTE